ncbi:hypothetical protein Theba_1121 [Mesotoga prima MesG1.Ag.4.2]|uniref:Uncharacterized protein n=1 Tax=Mesotoga prima MesG1.Ag.4.2 TaxID=660470 RepID=I2F4H3_9BACT|nr:hypothetical protein Theba_1121 [Mesotoga prima MesG1.Ag.4.2]
MLSLRSSSFIRKADRHEVSTFSLTATIIVVKSFLRIQVIAYISTTDHRSRSVPIFRSQRLAISVKRVFDGRSRIGALRDDSKGESRDGTLKRHPDNAPGQDPYPSRKRDRPHDPVSPYFRLQRLAFSEKRVFDGRSRTGALRDDRPLSKARTDFSISL